MLIDTSPSRSTPPPLSESESESVEAPPSRFMNWGVGFGCMIVMGILALL